MVNVGKLVEVLDISGSQTFSYWNIDDGDTVEEHTVPQKLLTTLVVKQTEGDKHPHQKSYLYDPNEPVLGDIIDDNGLLQEDRVVLLSEILADLATRKQTDRLIKRGKSAGTLAEEFFDAENAYLLKKTDGLRPDYRMVLVPDSASTDYQQTILNAAGGFLLWRSMAFCVGAEDLLRSEGVKEGDRILFLDKTTTGFMGTVVKFKEEDHRLIPCRALYQDPYEKVNRSAYPITQEETKHKLRGPRSAWDKYLGGDIQEPYLGFDLEKGLWMSGRRSTDTRYVSMPFHLMGYKLIFVHAPECNVILPMGSSPTRKVDDDMFLLRGAARCRQLINEGKVPYYDQCEALRLVIKPPKGKLSREQRKYWREHNPNHYQVLYNPTALIPEGYVPGGKRQDYPPVHGVSIETGKDAVTFFLAMGKMGDETEDRKIPLKALTQKFVMNKDDLKTSVPLELRPTFIPGQGRAIVQISCLGEFQPFAPCLLDWKKMETKETETVAYLEEQASRAYPSLIPPVQAREDFPWDTLDYMRTYNEAEKGGFYFLYGSGVPNVSRWPNPKADGIERFQRYNVFGFDYRYYGPQKGVDVWASFYPKLANEFVSYLKVPGTYSHGDADSVNTALRWLAWSYYGYDIPGRDNRDFHFITTALLKQLEGHNLRVSLSDTMTYLANNLSRDDEFVTFLRVLGNKLSSYVKEDGGTINNWLRAAYQILMYNSFLESEGVSDEDVRGCMELLIKVVLKNDEHRLIQDNACRVMLFLLKRRAYNPEFCQKNSSDTLDVDLYNEIREKLGNLRNCGVVPNCNPLLKFLDNEGRMQDIPVGDGT